VDQQPRDVILTPDPLVLRLSLPPLKLVSGWPWEKSRPKKVREAQTVTADFSQLSYIGVSTERDAELRKQNPDLTANDYIREALHTHNRLPLLEAARVYAFSNLIANRGFVEIMQELQDKAREGDTRAKATLKAFGEALGASGRGKKPAKTKQRQEEDEKDGEHIRRIVKHAVRGIKEHKEKLMERGADKETAARVAKTWRLADLQENSRIKSGRKSRVLAAL
jgi:hypothetical protein